MDAMSQVLHLIATSRADEGPVFDAILENAKSLCHAQMAGLILAHSTDDTQRLVAHLNLAPQTVEMFETERMKVDPDLSDAARFICDGRLIVWDDMGQSDLHREGSPVVRAMVDDANMRSVLFVPLLKDGAAIGLITLFRDRINPFDPAEIALVETFATQAVIAIDNARQFRTLQNQLQREEASAKILSVISQSRADATEVFDAVLEQAVRVCDADQAALDRETIHVPDI